MKSWEGRIGQSAPDFRVMRTMVHTGPHEILKMDKPRFQDLVSRPQVPGQFSNGFNEYLPFRPDLGSVIWAYGRPIGHGSVTNHDRHIFVGAKHLHDFCAQLLGSHKGTVPFHTK